VRVINTTAFVLALVVVLGYYLFSVRKWKTQNKNNSMPMEKGKENNHEMSLVTLPVNEDTEENDELVAIMTAAIHEFTGSADFQVVKIKPSATNWTLTGWQNSLRNPQ